MVYSSKCSKNCSFDFSWTNPAAEVSVPTDLFPDCKPFWTWGIVCQEINGELKGKPVKFVVNKEYLSFPAPELMPVNSQVQLIEFRYLVLTFE